MGSRCSRQLAGLWNLCLTPALRCPSRAGTGLPATSTHSPPGCCTGAPCSSPPCCSAASSRCSSRPALSPKSRPRPRRPPITALAAAAMSRGTPQHSILKRWVGRACLMAITRSCACAVLHPQKPVRNNIGNAIYRTGVPAPAARPAPRSLAPLTPPSNSLTSQYSAPWDAPGRSSSGCRPAPPPAAAPLARPVRWGSSPRLLPSAHSLLALPAPAHRATHKESAPCTSHPHARRRS